MKFSPIGHSPETRPQGGRRTTARVKGGPIGGIGQQRRRRAVQAVALAGAVALSGWRAQPSLAEQVRLDPAQRPRIVNGVETQGYPTAGALLYGPSSLGTASLWCSGTLIGCETFLVAAHCVGDPNPAHYAVYLQHAGVLPVASIVRHPSYTSAGFPLFDAAVIKLGSWVTGIAPTAVNQVDPQPFIPALGTIVGFGLTDGDNSDYGIKRAGQIETAACPAEMPADATDDDVVCWNFAAPIGPPGSESNTCNGDSGGPLFLDLGSGAVVGGITSGGFSPDCQADDTSYDANVFTHRSFILGELGEDAVAACGGLPAVGTAQTSEAAFDGTLTDVHASDTYTVELPTGANALRVTVNGEDNGSFDVDLYVKEGLGASRFSFDCAADDATTFGGCAIDLPGAGTWSIAVERAAGAGRYQLTATVFGGGAPDCGNGVREFTEACDGADAAQCPGQCTAACTCPLACEPDGLAELKTRIDAAKFKVRGLLLNGDGAFTGADPRQGFTLTLSQGANVTTVDMPPSMAGWETSKPERGRYKWKGFLNGITRIKAIDRTAKTGAWKIIVIGQAVPGAGAIDLMQPIDVTLTMDGVCATGTYVD